MKKLIGILAMLVLPLIIFSQRKIDSLKREVTVKSGIDQFEAMIELTLALWEKDSVEHALSVLEDARAIAFRTADTANIILTCRMAGIIYERLSILRKLICF